MSKPINKLTEGQYLALVVYLSLNCPPDEIRKSIKRAINQRK